ncbi:MAG: MerR family transcriptional regulator [Nitrospirae bacterium]|nr:MerR family transcriptional regulator [Nitrospirota bacterium]
MQNAFKSSYPSLFPAEPFPRRLFYKIGEVSRITSVESYVLRYWETEFPSLRPRKDKSGIRTYTKKDIDLILSIKNLLYGEKYTIDGARKRLMAADNHMGRNNIPAPPEEKGKERGAGRSNNDVSVMLKRVKDRLGKLLKQLG